MTASLWWVLALLLGILELLSGTFFALMLALAAAVTALAVHAGVQPWPEQAGVFAVLAVLLCLFWMRRRPRVLRPDDNALNQGQARWLGRVITLPQGLADGVGQVAVDDCFWQLRGPDCAPGSQVRVVAVEGNVLRVELVR